MAVPERLKSPKLNALLKDSEPLALTLSKMKTKQTTNQNTSPRYLFLIQDGTEWTILAQTGRMRTKDQTKPRLKETQQARHQGHAMAGWELQQAWGSPIPVAMPPPAMPGLSLGTVPLGACNFPWSWDFQPLQGSTITWASPSGLYTRGPLGLLAGSLTLLCSTWGQGLAVPARLWIPVFRRWRPECLIEANLGYTGKLRFRKNQRKQKYLRTNYRQFRKS